MNAFFVLNILGRLPRGRLGLAEGQVAAFLAVFN
jgi:hypothetical protein